MANLLRGQVPFKASGREMFICYGTREIAEAQTALGFRRPDPFQPDTVEEVGVQAGKDPGGRPTFRVEQRLIDAPERQRRMLAAFEAVLMNPDPEASLALFRVGLRPWTRETGQRLSDEQLAGVVDALGLVQIRLLHMQALSYGVYLKGEEQEENEGKAPAASVSST